jgi:hypothetical protein
MIERMQIYRLGVPDIPAGGSVIALPLKLDSDAPFSARAISFVGADGGVAGQEMLTGVRWKAPGGYRQSGFIPAGVMCPFCGSPTLGNGSAWAPIYPEVTWRESATIEVDVNNPAGTPLTGMAVLFRGVKSFPDSSQIPGASQYPQRCSSLPYDLPRYLQLPEVGALDNIALNAPPTGSLVVRGAVLSVSSKLASTAGEAWVNLKCQIQDRNHKPYMNDDIEAGWLFGNNVTCLQPFYPQIWLPPSGIMYYRLVRNDPGLGVLDFSVTWKGSKVFQR